MTDKDDNTGRDEKGRFAPGNPGGPGGSRKRAKEFQRAAEEAVTPEHIQALVRKAMRQALEGDLHAMRFVTERVMGRPVTTPTDPEPSPITLPALRSADDCNRAIDMLLNSITSGAIEHDTAKILLDTINARLKAIELSELEQRLSELENNAEQANGRPR